MTQTERFNTLIEFETELAFIRCEAIVAELDKLYNFDHDELVERYDTEDKAYDIIMHCNMDQDMRNSVKEYLDNHGYKGLYHFYNRLAN